MAGTSNHYDLIVLGDDIAGLVTAALVARRGRRVLVIPHGPIDGWVRSGQHSFAAEPAPIIHLGSPIVNRVMDELGLAMQLRRERQLLRERVHWVDSKVRLDATPRMGNFADEIAREYSDESASDAWLHANEQARATSDRIGELLDDPESLSAEAFFKRKGLTRLSELLTPAKTDDFSPLSSDHPLRTLTRRLAPWLVHLDPDQCSKPVLQRLWALWCDGPEDRISGAPGLREQLIGRIKLKSGEVNPALRVAEILHRRGKVTGVSLLGKSDHYGCEQLLIATDPGGLIAEGILATDGLTQDLAQALSQVSVLGRRFVLHVEIETSGLSPALDGLVVCRTVHGESGTSDGAVGTTFLRIEPLRDSSRVAIAITRIVHPGEVGTRETILEELDQQAILPFSRPWIAFAYSPHDGLGFTDGYGRPILDAAVPTPPIEMQSIWRARTEAPWGMALIPVATGTRNLHHASRMVFPGLGLEGEFSAGWLAAGEIAQPVRTGRPSRASLIGKAE